MEGGFISRGEMNTTNAAAAAALVRPLSHYLVGCSPIVEPQLHAAPTPLGGPIFEFTTRRPLPTRSYSSNSSSCHDSTEKLLREADLLFDQLAHGSSRSTATATAAAEDEAEAALGLGAPGAGGGASEGGQEPRARGRGRPRRQKDVKKKKASTRKRKEAVCSDQGDEREEEKEAERGSKKRRTRGKEQLPSAAAEEEEEEEEVDDGTARQGRPRRTRWRRELAVFLLVCNVFLIYNDDNEDPPSLRICTKRTPVLFKYGFTYATPSTGTRRFVCLHPSRYEEGEPCGAVFPTQHDLFEHRLAHEAEEHPDGMVSEEVRVKRLEVSAAVVRRLIEHETTGKRTAVRSKESARLRKYLREECASLGYARECEPSAGVVLQRYRWERFKAAKQTKSPIEELPTEKLRLRRRLQLEVMDKLMSEDTVLEELERDRVVSRISFLWDATKSQRCGVLMVKNMIIATLYNWVRRTYTTYAPPLYPPRKDKRAEKKRLERMKLADDEGEGEKEDEAEDDDTEDEMTMETYHQEEAAHEASEVKVEDEDEREATPVLQLLMSTAPPTPPTGQQIKPVGSAKDEPVVTGRELVLARRRRVMETLDAVLARQASAPPESQ